jgi:hypothetical protein
VTAPAPALPDDPGLLKTMLLEERAESERLRQIIKALQRHRFSAQGRGCGAQRPRERLQVFPPQQT